MARTVHLRSRGAAFQHLETLRRSRDKRHRHGEFFVEGVRAITQALAHGWPVRALAHSSERPLSAWAQGAVQRAGAEVHDTLPDAGMAELSDRHDRSELIAVLPIPADDPGRQQSRPDLCVLVIDRPGLPGTLGSLLRSIDALGGHGLIVVGHAADVYDPEVIRASTGSFFAVPVVRMERVLDVLAWRDSLRGALGDVPLGNETRGLSRAFLTACDHVVRISMHGSAPSLNVAAAGSVLLYEIGRQRRAGHST